MLRVIAEPLSHNACQHANRNRALTAAYASGSHTMQNIGDCFGLHCSRAESILRAGSQASDGFGIGSDLDYHSDMDARTIEIARYPNLRLLAWQLHRERIGEAEAFAIYEREWRHVDVDRLDPAERRLIEHLTRKYGRGVLNV